MANGLDELNDQIMNGRETGVIAKQIPVEKSTSAVVLEIFLWICGIIPGVIFFIQKKKAESYFKQIEQKLQHDASQIDNYMEQRVMILKNCAKLLDKAIDLDKDVFTKISMFRTGTTDDAERNNVSSQIDNVDKLIKMTVEKYPDLKAHGEIEEAMQQNSYLQREITAAREVYNDTINTWNREIFAWPIKQMVAYKKGYTTRIPYATTSDIKGQAREEFF